MKQIRPLLLLIFFNLISLLLLAQPGDPGGGGNPTPITGIEFLVGGGIILGIRKLISGIKSRKEE